MQKNASCIKKENLSEGNLSDCVLLYSRSVTVRLILLHLEMEMCVIISVCWVSPGKDIQLGERDIHR